MEGIRSRAGERSGRRLSALAAAAAAMLAVVGCGGSSPTTAASSPKPVIIGSVLSGAGISIAPISAIPFAPIGM